MSHVENPDLLEQNRVSELKAALAKLQSGLDKAVRGLKHREENEGSLLDRQEALEDEIAEQECLPKAAQDAKKKAECERKAALSQRDELRNEKCSVEEELEKFRMRGTFDEEEDHVDDLKEEAHKAQKDLEAAQIELEIMRKFPDAGPELRPYLGMLHEVHRARYGSPNIKEEIECSDNADEASRTGGKESKTLFSAKSEDSGDENKYSPGIRSDSESDCKETTGPSRRTSSPRPHKRRRTDSSLDSC